MLRRPVELASVKRTLNADFCTKCPYSGWAFRRKAGRPQAMLTEIYIEALLADQVWEAWDKGEIDDRVACILRIVIAVMNVRRRPERTANYQLELLPMSGFLRRIAVTDENDPHVVLEKLHEKWANATEKQRPHGTRSWPIH